MEVSATAKYIRVSPKKVNRVLAVIRNKPASVGLKILKLLPHRSAAHVRKALMSAVANATNNNDLSENDLIISKAIVGEGMRLKRFRARARGRAAGIVKRTSHITISVASKEEK